MCEILSPAGGEEQLLAALNAGCDAVYVGGGFSARKNAKNFSRAELKNAVYECHCRGVKLYQALNTVYFDDEREEIAEEIRYAADIGVDALIIQDLGVLKLVKEAAPDMPLHASTQMTIHSVSGAEWAKSAGFKRVVVSRECSLDVIREICKTGIEVEVFVHGALCMSVSGQCYLSAAVGGRSANRGLCAGACRLPFSANGKRTDEYALSLKDLCAFSSLSELKAAGVASFKIEGRMKRPEYVAAATKECRSALMTGVWNKEELAGVFSRDGFTNGYIEGSLGRDMFGFRTREDYFDEKKALGSVHESMRSVFKRFDLSFHMTVKKGERLKLCAFDNEGLSATVEGEIPTAAQNRPVDKDFVIRGLKKLGGSMYEFKSAEVDLDDGLFVSMAQINELRRKAVEVLDKARTEKNTVIKSFTKSAEPKGRAFEAPRERRISAGSFCQVQSIWQKADLVSLPFSELKKAVSKIPTEKLCLTLPRFMTKNEEERLKKEIAEAYFAGVKHFLLQNLAHIELLKELKQKDKEISLHSFFGFNITNSDALGFLESVGITDAVLSFETSAARISRIKKAVPTGALVYGYLPLMLTRNCPIASSVGCEKCKGKLFDRLGKEFSIECGKKGGSFELLNCAPLYLADKPPLDTEADWFLFTKETPGECADVIQKYDKKAPCGEEFTRGLYFRKLY